MYNDQTLELIRRYIQEGKDIQALFSDYNALLSSGKTPIGLNQWVKTDKPMMEDFNEDNRVIDAAIRALEDNKVGDKAKGPFDFPFDANHQGSAKYGKNSVGDVYIWIAGATRKDGGNFSRVEPLGALPEGFLPEILPTITAPGVFHNYTGSQRQRMRGDITILSGVVYAITPSDATNSEIANCMHFGGYLSFPMP